MSDDNTMQMAYRDFDPDQFLNTEYTDATDSERTLMPQGWCRIEAIEDFDIQKPRPFKDKMTGETVLGSPTIRLKCLVTDEKIREQLGAKGDRPLYTYIPLYLDINASGQLDMGPNKNLLIGQLRETFGQNIPGMHWSFPMFRGKGPFLAKYDHKVREEDGAVFERVTMIAPVDSGEEILG